MSGEINFEVAAEIQQMIQEHVRAAVADATGELEQRRDFLVSELERTRAEVTRLELSLASMAAVSDLAEQMAVVWDLGARGGLEHNERGPHYNAAAVDWAFAVMGRGNPYRGRDQVSVWAVTEDEFSVWYFCPTEQENQDLVANNLASTLEHAARLAEAHPDVIVWVMRRTVTEWDYADGD